ncbi:PAS domain-containing protein [Kordiimonas aquimaris]|uniref:PAS domain-containing protein n=1 Tax=Kordiimonas aquimaris TaxID=707591 RepID=UPI0021D1EB08|nr:PAS domain-containing protein [Kordiimonas aquimaris]
MSKDFDSIIERELFPDFIAAWQAARKGNAVPLRSDIRLQEFAKFADSLQIYELKSRLDLRCRLMGSRVSERVQQVGLEDNLFDFFGEASKKVGEKWWNGMASAPCGGIMCFSTHYSSGARKEVPSLVLPMTGSDGGVLFLAFNQLPRKLDQREPREKLTIADDVFEGKFIDIGFGLPEGIENPVRL